jgi:hypothetical protein
VKILIATIGEQTAEATKLDAAFEANLKEVRHGGV